MWNSYFKFCVVRNPFDKLVSAFYFLHDKSAGIAEFRDWIMRSPLKNIIWDVDKYKIGEQICVDYFIRYERLFEGICEVCKRLGIPTPNVSRIPRLKTGRRRKGIALRDYYDKACLRKVENVFSFELRHFGYDYIGENK
jgi:hypothetical protein